MSCLGSKKHVTFLTLQLHLRFSYSSHTDVLVCAIPRAVGRNLRPAVDYKGLLNGRVASGMLLCSGAASTWKAGKCVHLFGPQHYLDILRPRGSQLTLVAFIYSAANVRSGKKVGGEGRKTRLWLFFPSSLKLASSNNLQCALQQSRNQAGHTPSSFLIKP